MGLAIHLSLVAYIYIYIYKIICSCKSQSQYSKCVVVPFVHFELEPQLSLIMIGFLTMHVNQVPNNKFEGEDMHHNELGVTCICHI
jgi:hypothetical protein